MGVGEYRIEASRLGIACLVGAMAFLAWGGAIALVPTHIRWLMPGQDISSHYLAWEYFRQAPWWQWPLGANPAYGADAPGTVVLADAIPIVAILLKPFSAYLPADFQYFGLWAFLCFILQAWFGYRLMLRFSRDAVLCALGSAFFATSSIFLIRAYIHPALAGQWTILAAIHLGLATRFPAWRWFGLLVITVLVHAYLFVMVGTLWLLCGMDHLRCSRHRERWMLWAYMLATLCSVVLVMWAAGYFVPASVTTMAVRTHFNLLMPVWSGFCGGGEWSWVARCLPVNSSKLALGDGFGYFGLGYLLLLAVAVWQWLTGREGDRSEPDWRRAVPVVLGCALLLAFAVSNKLYLGERILFDIPLSSRMDHLLGVFRGGARMMWPAWYMLLLATLVTVATRLKPGAGKVLLACALLLQCADLSRAARHTWHQLSRGEVATNRLTAPTWKQLASTHRHVVFIQPADVSPYLLGWMDEYKEVTHIAMSHGDSINQAPLARLSEVALAQARTRREALLSMGLSEPDTFYVVVDESLWGRVLCAPEHDQWRGDIDGLHVVIPDPASATGLPTASTCPKGIQ